MSQAPKNAGRLAIAPLSLTDMSLSVCFSIPSVLLGTLFDNPLLT
jgi:hypothetical protein